MFVIRLLTCYFVLRVFVFCFVCLVVVSILCWLFCGLNVVYWLVRCGVGGVCGVCFGFCLVVVSLLSLFCLGCLIWF